MGRQRLVTSFLFNVSFFFLSFGVVVLESTSTENRSYSQKRQENVRKTESINGKIVGGREIEEEYSFLVALMNREMDDNVEHICGGTLIAPDLVLSAAHCAYDPAPDVVQIGRLNLTDETESYEELEIIMEVSHRDYDSGTSAHDLVIYKIEESTLVPIPLNDDHGVPSENIPMIVMGWGAFGDGSYPDHAYEATVHYVPTETCKEVYDDELYEEFMMCAVGEDGQDNCSGDSGGPLIIKDYSGENQHLLVGVVSWGRSCGNPGIPSVYANVSAEIDWIKRTMCMMTNVESVKETVCPPETSALPARDASIMPTETSMLPSGTTMLPSGTTMLPSGTTMLPSGTTLSLSGTTTLTSESTLSPSKTSSTIPATGQESLSSPTCDKPSVLVETMWMFTRFDELNEDVKYDAKITAYFSDDGYVYGHGGCNTYVGRYIVENSNHIDVDERLAISRNMCFPTEGLYDQEMEYVDYLLLATSYRIDCHELKLMNDDGSVLLSFVGDPPPKGPSGFRPQARSSIPPPKYTAASGQACVTSNGGMGTAGSDYMMISHLNLQECMDKCSVDTNCDAFEYSDNRCELWKTGKVSGTTEMRGFYCFRKETLEMSRK